MVKDSVFLLIKLANVTILPINNYNIKTYSAAVNSISRSESRHQSASCPERFITIREFDPRDYWRLLAIWIRRRSLIRGMSDWNSGCDRDFIHHQRSKLIDQIGTEIISYFAFLSFIHPFWSTDEMIITSITNLALAVHRPLIGSISCRKHSTACSGRWINWASRGWIWVRRRHSLFPKSMNRTCKNNNDVTF